LAQLSNEHSAEGTLAPQRATNHVSCAASSFWVGQNLYGLFRFKKEWLTTIVTRLQSTMSLEMAGAENVSEKRRRSIDPSSGSGTADRSCASSQGCSGSFLEKFP